MAGLGKNKKVNAVEPTMKSHKVVAQLPRTQKPTITHEEERAALVLFLTGGFAIWYAFR